MVALEAIRRFATEFPEVQESAHFRFQQPVFKVRDAAAIVAEDPATFEEVWRPGATKSFVGVRVDLARVSEERVRELIERAWRTRAPRRVLAAYDAQRPAQTRG